MRSTPQIRISVVVPTRNALPFLEQCLRSVREQTLEPFEILICDDASDDGTREEILRLAGQDARIQPVLHDERKGIVGNFNSGLERARGDWVTLVAGDDFWMPCKLELEARELQRTGRRWAYSKVAFADPAGSPTAAARNTEGDRDGDVLESVLLRQVAPRSPLIARELLEAVGLFDPDFCLFEDWDLRIRLAAAAPVAHVRETTVCYRLHPAGSSRSPLALRMEMALAVVRKHRALLAIRSPDFLAQMRRRHLDWFGERFRDESPDDSDPGERLRFRTSFLQLDQELRPVGAPSSLRSPGVSAGASEPVPMIRASIPSP